MGSQLTIIPMKLKKLIFPLVLFGLGSLVLEADDQGQPSDGSPSSRSETEEVSGLSYTESFILGVVEGLTEYLPISSTGHLILTDRFFDRNEPETNLNQSQKQEARNAYLIVIQGGAILAVILVYWEKILAILMGLVGRNPRGLALGLKVLVAFLPAAILGPLLNDIIESKLFNPQAVSVALAIGAIAMIWMERNYRKKQRAADGSDSKTLRISNIEDLSFKSSLFIGFMQCLAMWPGMSRSMVTIVGGYLSNMEAKAAAEFSFMLGLLTLTAASVYSLLGSWEVMTTQLEVGPMILGLVVATLVAFVAVKWFVNFLSKHGLYVFAYYRLILAAVILYVFGV